MSKKWSCSRSQLEQHSLATHSPSFAVIFFATWREQLSSSITRTQTTRVRPPVNRYPPQMFQIAISTESVYVLFLYIIFRNRFDAGTDLLPFVCLPHSHSQHCRRTTKNIHCAMISVSHPTLDSKMHLHRSVGTSRAVERANPHVKSKNRRLERAMMIAAMRENPNPTKTSFFSCKKARKASLGDVVQHSEALALHHTAEALNYAEVNTKRSNIVCYAVFPCSEYNAARRWFACNFVARAFRMLHYCEWVRLRSKHWIAHQRTYLTWSEKTENCAKKNWMLAMCASVPKSSKLPMQKEKQAEVKWGRMWSLLRQRSVSKWIWKTRYTAEVNIDFFRKSKNNNEIPF